MKPNDVKFTMKKLFLTFIFIVSSKILFSQTVLLNPSENYVGISFGVNNSMVMFTPSVDQEMLFLGTSSGIAYRWITEKHAGLQIELKYSQRGWKELSGLYTRRINYIEIPFLTHVYFGNTHRLFFNFGPKFSFLLNEQVLKNDTLNSTSEQHIKKVYHPFEYGGALGFGYDLHTRNAGVFEIEARGYYGLSNIFADSKSDYFSTSNYLNISLNLAWYFQFTGKK